MRSQCIDCHDSRPADTTIPEPRCKEHAIHFWRCVLVVNREMIEEREVPAEDQVQSC